MDRKYVIATIASGALCALLMFAFTQQVAGQSAKERAEALERYGGEQVEVCVATDSIAVGEVPSYMNTATQMWVSGLLPEEPVTSLSEVSNKPVTSPVVKGEVLSMRHFDATAVSIDIPEGCSALSVPAEDVKAVGGAVAAGNYVDVYLSGPSGISLISKNTLVLATSVGSDESSSSKGKFSWITLAVSPSSVEELLAAADKGTLYYVLPGKVESEKAEEAQGGSSSSEAASAQSNSSSGAAASSKTGSKGNERTSSQSSSNSAASSSQTAPSKARSKSKDQADSKKKSSNASKASKKKEAGK